MADLRQIVERLDRELRCSDIPDYPQAKNGLQLENSGAVTRVATAVDFSLRSCRAAAATGASLLIVHHGIFWGGDRPIVGVRYEQIRSLIEADIALYSAHLPLDVHPSLGNNALLARELGLEPTGSFNRYQSIDVGITGEADVPASALVEKLRQLAGRHGGSIVSTPIEPSRRTRRWGICTGGGASSSSVAEALALELDTLVVGEGPHHTAVEAIDSGLTVIYAGHYATETFGVIALGELVSREFSVESSFVESPTGL
jgi:dinuclear metal center YbgI/SA1388 family protein